MLRFHAVEQLLRAGRKTRVLWSRGGTEDVRMRQPTTERDG
jgi:hypothetical protein